MMDAEVEVNDCNQRSLRQEGNPDYKLLTGREIRPFLHRSIHQRMYCLHTIGLSSTMCSNHSACRSVVQIVLYLYILYHK